MAHRVSAGLSKSEGRKFGLTLGVAFSVLAAVLLWRDRGTAAGVVGALGGLFLFAGIVLPTKLGPVEKAWMGLALAISKVTTPIIMGIVYYLVVLPIGVAVRTFGRNPLVHVANGDSFWVDRTDERKRQSDLRRQF